ncbi:MAG TPA: hypothetical protein VGM51_04795 [Armatimonadota bacterium]
MATSGVGHARTNYCPQPFLITNTLDDAFDGVAPPSRFVMIHIDADVK